MVDIISNSKSSSEKKKFLLGLFRFLAQSMIYYEIMMHYVLYARAITSAALPCVWITKRKRTSKSKITTLIRGFYFSAGELLRGLENN
jgi:hypothetical protein